MNLLFVQDASLLGSQSASAATEVATADVLLVLNNNSAVMLSPHRDTPGYHEEDGDAEADE